MKLKTKRFLSLALALVLVVTCLSTMMLAEDVTTPSVKVEELTVENMTFAANFTAETIPEAYKSWPAEFVVTVYNDTTFNGASNALYVNYAPLSEGVSTWIDASDYAGVLTAKVPWKMMATAGIADSHTYEAFSTIKTGFGIGMKLEKPNTSVKVELELTSPETGATVVVASYRYGAPDLPTATAKEIEEDKLTFAMNFTLDEVSEEQMDYYEKWYADFELTVNKDVTLNAATCDTDANVDGFLSGRYDNWNKGNWVNVPIEDVKLEANKPLRIMEFAAELMSQSGLKQTFKDIYTSVKSFDCGIFFKDEFLANNPDLEVKLELKVYADDNDAGTRIGDTYVFTAAEHALPTATATEIENDDLTFAMNFTVDDVTDAQLAYFEKWYTDFELTVNKDVTLNADSFGKDSNVAGYLSGRYDEWNNGNWVNVPIEDVELKANEPMKIMAYAAELMGVPGLKQTFKDIYTTVKDFDCGVLFSDKFLADNPDLVVTLELKMYDPANVNDEGTVIGETYIFTAEQQALPTATATRLNDTNLTFAMNFLLDDVTAAQKSYYKKWFTDFELTVNKDVVLNAAECGAKDHVSGYLSGSYDAWNNGNWVNVPIEDVALKANEPMKIMAYAAELMGVPGLQQTFKDIYDTVKDFNCGVFFTEEFLEANPDLEVKLELKMYNPDDLSESYLIGETYIFNLSGGDAVAVNVQTEKTYTEVNAALAEAKANQTVRLLKSTEAASAPLFVMEDVTLDLDGYELTAAYVSSFGDIIDGSEANTGFLVVDESHLLFQKDNKQLPVETANGYVFIEVLKFNKAVLENGAKYAFQPFVEKSGHKLMTDGAITVSVMSAGSRKTANARRHLSIVLSRCRNSLTVKRPAVDTARCSR